MFVDIMKVFIL